MKTVTRGVLRRGAAGARMVAALGARGIGLASDAELGDRLTHEMDQLKGLSMKVGQMLSTMDVGLPEEVVLRMARLQRGREGVPIESFGVDLSMCEDVNPQPVAAASIAQVHRARLRGRPVAVKLRYPGIEALIQQDLSNVSGIATMAALMSDVDTGALLAELRARLMEECDFRKEAAWLQRVVLPPGVRVPEVLHAQEDLLITEWIDGGPVDASVADRLFQLTWGSLFRHGFLHADPHPGNFIVNEDLWVLDWGNTRAFTPDEVAGVRRLATVVVEGRRGEAEDALRQAGFLVARSDVDTLWELQRWWWRPYTRGRGQLDRGWMADGVRFKRASIARKLRMAMPPAWIWVNRVALGVHAVVARTGAVVDPGAILRAALAD